MMGNNRVPSNRAKRRRQERGSRRNTAPEQGSNRSLIFSLGLFLLVVLAVLALAIYNLR